MCILHTLSGLHGIAETSLRVLGLHLAIDLHDLLEPGGRGPAGLLSSLTRLTGSLTNSFPSLGHYGLLILIYRVRKLIFDAAVGPQTLDKLTILDLLAYRRLKVNRLGLDNLSIAIQEYGGLCPAALTFFYNLSEHTTARKHTFLQTIVDRVSRTLSMDFTAVQKVHDTISYQEYRTYQQKRLVLCNHPLLLDAAISPQSRDKPASQDMLALGGT